MIQKVSDAPVLVLFRDDLRVRDNPALLAAAETEHAVACVYIDETEETGVRPLGGATKWWLHGALQSLEGELAGIGGDLRIVSSENLGATIEAIRPAAVFWNRRYGKTERDRDAALKQWLQDSAIEAKSFNAALLYEPWEVTSTTGGSMKVYSPFWRAAERLRKPAAPRSKPKAMSAYRWNAAAEKLTKKRAELELLPTKPDWAGGILDCWEPSEKGADEALAQFLDHGFRGYAEKRNNPDQAATSRLSPYLRFGQISPRQVWQSAEAAVESGQSPASNRDLEVFRKELGWREFSYHLLFHHPSLASANFQAKFDDFPWRDDPDGLKAWQAGRTGYPLVDAGMRQLWQTGWMHNRIRMVTASFLIKHLLIDWRRGEEWFWDTLVDADPANNAASWQWVAGSGADAAPYYRIFNPVLQGEKFDPAGKYVRMFVPELAELPDEFIHKPWMAPEAVLNAAGIDLGKEYPAPIVDHSAARARALAALKTISLNHDDRA